MRGINFICSVVFILAGCDRYKSKHPQAALTQDSASLNQTSIQAYADSINQTLVNFEKQNSLIYSAGDYSFYVTKYSYNNNPVLYIENISSHESASTKNFYYLRNKSLVLAEQQLRGNSEDSTAFTFSRNYYRNNTLFYSIKKIGKTEQEAAKAVFKPYLPEVPNLRKDLDRIENALGQNGEFELFFAKVTEDPANRYIVLNSAKTGQYEAAIKVEKEDDFIKDLFARPETYKGQKLVLEWQLKDSTGAIYVAGKQKSL